MPRIPHPPADADALRQAILARYDALSKRLKQVARHVLDAPDEVALETLSVLAGRCGVQPSAIVRFAQGFGFEGASQMQRLLRESLLSAHAALEYGERIRRFHRASGDPSPPAPGQLLAEFVQGNALALRNLEGSAGPQLDAAVDMLRQADTVYVAGFRRSFAVAAYLAYSLGQVDKKTVFIDAVGGMGSQQLHGITRRDVLLLVSYFPYAEEAVRLMEAASQQGCKLLSISDSALSPVARPAHLVLQVREAEVRGFRSLASSMCLAQSLVIAYAFARDGAQQAAEAQVGKKPSTDR